MNLSPEDRAAIEIASITDATTVDDREERIVAIIRNEFATYRECVRRLVEAARGVRTFVYYAAKQTDWAEERLSALDAALAPFLEQETAK